MTREELEMRQLVRESDVIDRTDGSALAKAFNHLWEKYVEQEPKTGRWIDSPNGYFTHCSECDYGNVDLVGGRPHNYCPNCGAKMESDIEKRKPCINYEDGCEEWAGCPCVYYKGRKRG